MKLKKLIHNLFELDDATHNFIKINFQITENCNLNCWYCNANTNKKTSQNKHVTISDFFKVIKYIKSLSVNNNIRLNITGGEPTIHPNFERMMDRLPDNILVVVYSNAAKLINSPKIDYIIYSNHSNQLLNNISTKHSFEIRSFNQTNDPNLRIVNQYPIKMYSNKNKLCNIRTIDIDRNVNIKESCNNFTFSISKLDANIIIPKIIKCNDSCDCFEHNNALKYYE